MDKPFREQIAEDSVGEARETVLGDDDTRSTTVVNQLLGISIASSLIILNEHLVDIRCSLERLERG